MSTVMDREHVMPEATCSAFIVICRRSDFALFTTSREAYVWILLVNALCRIAFVREHSASDLPV